MRQPPLLNILNHIMAFCMGDEHNGDDDNNAFCDGEMVMVDVVVAAEA